MSDYLAAMHDPCPSELFSGKPGWCVVSMSLTTERIEDWRPRIRKLHDAGITPIVRLNYAYHPNGTIPTPDKYGMFADACGNFVQHFPYVRRWIIGNEPNLSIERPRGQVITPELYAHCFDMSQAVIKTVDTNHEVIMSAVGLWNIETGDWLDYQRRVLELTEPDGIAIHTYSRGHSVAAIHSEAKMQSHPDRYVGFKAYRDLMSAIPASHRHLPVYLTETNPNEEWRDENRGWIQAALAEIDWWNRQAGNQRIHCVATYRYERHDDKWMEGKNGLLEDFRLASQKGYPSMAPQTDTPTQPTSGNTTGTSANEPADPRADNCKATAFDGSGMAVGVHLTHERRPGTRFFLKRVRLINEYEAGGQTVASVTVLDKDGIPTFGSVVLGYPWPPGMQHGLYPGNSHRPAEHTITNKFWEPHQGPLCIFVGAPGQPESDVIGGLGLPRGHHVSFEMVFQQRGAPEEPEQPEEPEEPDDILTEDEIREAIAKADAEQLIELNPTAALQKAMLRDNFIPVGNEFTLHGWTWWKAESLDGREPRYYNAKTGVWHDVRFFTSRA